MRISDWSSDVCSSDLTPSRISMNFTVRSTIASTVAAGSVYPRSNDIGKIVVETKQAPLTVIGPGLLRHPGIVGSNQPAATTTGKASHMLREIVIDQLGRASCRERVCT